MQRILFFLFSFLCLSWHPAIRVVHIPDEALLHALIAHGVDANGDSLISVTEAEAVSTLVLPGKGISDMTGIEAFINLDTLSCPDNPLTKLDVSNYSNTYMRYGTQVDRSRQHRLSCLDVSGCAFLKELRCFENPLATLRITGTDSLWLIDCARCSLDSLDLGSHNRLEWLFCEENELSSLALPGQGRLAYLNCGHNQLEQLDVHRQSRLLNLRCSHNRLDSLDASASKLLETLICDYNRITGLQVSGNPLLRSLVCTGNRLAELDVTGNPLLRYLECAYNRLTRLDVSRCTELWQLDCAKNQLNSLDVSQNRRLGTMGYGLNISNMPSLRQVCVWTMPFPPWGVRVYRTGSPNAYFTTNCSRLEGGRRFVAYPNPVVSLLTIETPMAERFTVEITLADGQGIYTAGLSGSKNTLDLSVLQQGVYFLTVRAGDYAGSIKIVKLE